MAERTMAASAFKARCLRVLDEVAESGQTVVVTKRGRPVARVAPVEPPKSLLGSVTFNVSDEELIYGRVDRWDVEPE